MGERILYAKKDNVSRSSFIQIEHWREKIEDFLDDKNFSPVFKLDCSIEEIVEFKTEVRFFINRLELDSPDFRTIKEEIERRFPGCFLLRHDEKLARNSSRPCDRPPYYISVTQRAQEMVNQQKDFKDFLGAMVTNSVTWKFLICLVLFVCCLWIALNYWKDYSSPFKNFSPK